jgi:hypothetical protein
MGDGSFQWERAFFRDLPAGNPLTDIDIHFTQLIKCLRPCDRTKFMAIAPKVSPPQYGEVAAFVFFLLLTSPDCPQVQQVERFDTQTTQFHLRKCLFGSQWQKMSSRGLFFPTKILGSLAGRGKTHESFWAYLHEGSTDKHQVYL